MPRASHFDLGGRRAMVVGVESPAATAIALAFAEAGADVALCTLEPNEAVPAARRVARRIADMGRRSAVYTMDVMLGRNVQVTTRQVAKELGGLDVVVSAPDRFLAKPITRITDSELANVLRLNFSAHFFVVRQAVSEMQRNTAGGRVIVVTSVLGDRGLPNTSAYAAATGAAHNLVRAVAQEVAPRGITVNGIALGWMDWQTDRLDPADEEAQRATRFPIAKRMGTAEDVGPLAVYLAGTGAGYVTGQIFPVDGGLLQHL